MVRNLTKTCEICLKSMRGDHLTRHMKKHEKELIVVVDKNSAKCDICMKTMIKDNLKRHMMNHEKKNNKDRKGVLYNDMTMEMQEFNRKKKMGRKIKEIKEIKEIMENNANFNVNALTKEKKEALDIFNLYGKSSRM